MNQLPIQPFRPIPLIDIQMHDGSRRFACLPMSVLWDEFRNNIVGLNGSDQTDFITDGVTEAWIDFHYRGQRFTVNDQLGEYWCLVEDPGCPDDLLHEVVVHVSTFLKR
jgi:hypothetical protein